MSGPNTSGDIFPVGLLARSTSGVVQVWNGSAWVTYTGSVPTNVPLPGIPLPTYVSANGSGIVVQSISAAGGIFSTTTLVEVTTGSSNFNINLPLGVTGMQAITVVKIDSGSGAATILGVGGATVNGDSAGYAITTQWQSATFSFDGSNWVVSSNN